MAGDGQSLPEKPIIAILDNGLEDTKIEPKLVETYGIVKRMLAGAKRDRNHLIWLPESPPSTSVFFPNRSRLKMDKRGDGMQWKLRFDYWGL